MKSIYKLIVIVIITSSVEILFLSPHACMPMTVSLLDLLIEWPLTSSSFVYACSVCSLLARG